MLLMLVIEELIWLEPNFELGTALAVAAADTAAAAAELFTVVMFELLEERPNKLSYSVGK